MTDPFLLILGAIAVACLVLYPIRRWQQTHHRYGDEQDPSADEQGDVPLAPPERRNRG